MAHSPHPRKSDQLVQYLRQKATAILGHARFEITLDRAPLRWLAILWLHPNDKLSRRKRARLRNELWSTLEDVDLRVDVHISIQYKPRIIPHDQPWADILYVFAAEALFSELEILLDVIKEQTDLKRQYVLCRYALLQSYETVKHMLRALNSIRRNLRGYSEARAAKCALEDFPKNARKSLQSLEELLRPYRNQYAAHRLFEKDNNASLLIEDMAQEISLITPFAVEMWYNDLALASQETVKFIKKHYLTLFLTHPASKAQNRVLLYDHDV